MTVYKPGMVEVETQASLEDMYGEWWNDCAKMTPPYAKLPHSCDSWIIGGMTEVEQMIADLQTALAQMKGESK